MSDIKQELIGLVENIINQELNEIEKQSFDIEGQELIEKILKAENTNVVIQSVQSNRNIDFGISPQELIDIVKETATFGGVIVSIFNLYFELKKFNKSKVEAQTSSLELKNKVFNTLMEQDIPNALKEKIKEKYATQLLNIFDKQN